MLTIENVVYFLDDSILTSFLGQVSCDDETHYCGFTMGGYGEEGDNVFIEVSFLLIKSKINP